MEKNSPSRVQFTMQSSLTNGKTEQQILDDFGKAPVVVGLGFKGLVSKVGLSRAIRSLYYRYRYTACLYLVREIYLWKGLNQKFDEIPHHMKEYRFLKFVNNHRFVQKLASRVEIKCLNVLTCKTLKPSLTVSNSSNS